MFRYSIILALLATPLGRAVEYYISQQGNDAGSGLCPKSAWKSLAAVSRIRFRPGDHVRLECGGLWRESISVNGSGEPGKPIVLEAYGTGRRPIISGADVIEGWQMAGVGRWRARVSAEPTQLFRNGQRLDRRNWYYDTTDARVYLHADQGPDSGQDIVEASFRAACIRIANHSHVSVRDLGVRQAAVSNIDVYASIPIRDLTFENLVSEFGARWGLSFYNDHGGNFVDVMIAGITDAASAGLPGATSGIMLGTGPGGPLTNITVRNVHVEWSGKQGDGALPPAGSFGIDLDQVRNAVLENIEVDHCGSSGINIQNGSAGVVIRHSSVHDNGLAPKGDRNGIGIGGIGHGSSDIVIETVDVYRNHNPNIEIATTDLNEPMQNIFIRNCTLRDGYRSGIQVGGGHRRILLVANHIYGNTEKDVVLYEGTSGKPDIDIQ